MIVASRRLCILLAALVALLVVLRIRLTNPPDVPTEIDANHEFATKAALRHVKELAANPRPVGSPAHAAARDYIIAELKRVGLSTETQHATRVNTRWGVPYDVGRVINVIAKIPGQTPGPAVALSAHYDSVPNAPGAADDATGVAVLLETARALRSGPAPRYDTLFLFMDAEEAGVLGSRAFVALHPWAKTIGLALNFDARGARGPVGLVETSAEAGALVRHFATNTRFPVASSLFPEVSRRLGHETDLRPFLLAGTKGLNFAFADGVAHYHAPTDDVAHLDPRSVAHAGAQALALARAFGETNIDQFTPERVIYFDVPGIGVLVLPEITNWLMALGALGLWGFAISRAKRREKSTLFGIFGGFLGLVAPFIVAIMASTTFVLLLRALLPAFGAYRGDPPEPTFIRLALAFLGIGFYLGSYWLFRRRFSSWDLAFGAIGAWVVLALAAAKWLPGGSHVFAIPALAQLLACVVLLRFEAERHRPEKNALVLLLAALPTMIVAVPVPYLLFIALGLPKSAVAVSTVVLLAGLLGPLWEMLGAAKSKWPIISVASAFVGALALAMGFARFSPESPRPVCLAYALDHGTKKALWISSDEDADPWVRAHATTGVFRPSFPLPGQGDLAREGPAPVIDLPAPAIDKIGEEERNGVRTLRLRIRSVRGAPFVLVSVTSEAPILRATIDGQTIEEDKPASWKADEPWGFSFQGLPPEGIEWSMDLAGSGATSVRVVDRSYELPEHLLYDKLPADRMPMPFRLANSTFVAAVGRY